MTALADNRMGSEFRIRYRQMTLASGKVAYQNAAAFLDPTSNTVQPASSKTGLIYLGLFTEKVDATSAALPVNVDFIEEIVCKRFVNDTGSPIASTDVGQIAYFVDDQTVSISGAGRTVAGRIWDVDATKGVAVQKLHAQASATLSQPAATTPAAYVSNDLVITSVSEDAVYDVPTTAAASTITLPAASPDGTRVSFAADGTKNGNTVQYRDATGPTNLTTALTASKRHLVICQKLGGKWFANAYVSP